MDADERDRLLRSFMQFRENTPLPGWREREKARRRPGPPTTWRIRSPSDRVALDRFAEHAAAILGWTTEPAAEAPRMRPVFVRRKPGEFSPEDLRRIFKIPLDDVGLKCRRRWWATSRGRGRDRSG